MPPAGSPSGPSTPGAATGGGGGPTGDLTSWTSWWGFRRDPFIDLKAAIYSAAPTTQSGTFPLGGEEKAQADTIYRPAESRIRTEIVPALLALLEVERNKDIRTACMIALAKIGDDPRGEPELARRLAGWLTDKNQEVAETAALALGILADDRAVPELAHLLADDDRGRKLVGERGVPDRTRAFAAYGLGLAGARTAREEVRRFAVSHLSAALGSGGFSARDVPVACALSLGLVRLRPGSLPGKDGLPQPASASRAAQVQFLLGVFADRERDALLRAHIPGALGNLLEDEERRFDVRVLKGEVARALIEALSPHSREWKEVRQGCVLGLSLIGDGDADALDAEIRGALEREADQGEILSRSLSLVALAEVAARRGAGAEPRAAVAEIRRTMVQLLARGTTLSRPWAAFALALLERSLMDQGEPPTEDVGRALRLALANAASPEESGALCLALGLVRDPLAAPLVRERFESLSEDEPKGYAAIALGLLRAADAAPALRGAVESSRYRPALLREAAIALALVGDKDAVPLLVGELERASSLASQAAIASALGTVGDARAVEPLLALLRDESKTDRARAFAAAALGIVGDKEPLPFNAKLARIVVWSAAAATLSDPSSGTGILDLL